MRHLLFGIKYVANYWITGQLDPLICGLVLHNKCNLRCRHCTVIDRPPGTLTFSEATGVIDDFYDQNGRCLYLEGGEPFTWKDHDHGMEDIVEYAKRKGYFTVIIYTNGTHELESAADTLFVSVDGLQATHDYLRGKSFDRIMENIWHSAHPSIFINYTINSVNKNDIAAFCEYVDGIPSVRGSFFYFHTPYYGFDDLYLEPEEKKEILGALMHLKNKFRILNSKAGLESALRNDWKKNLPCCRVYEEGRYYTCCRESREGSVCEHCGYLSYAEIDQTLKLKPDAIANALKYF